MRKQLILFVGILLVVALLQSCDSSQLIDENREINNYNWSYIDTQKFEIDVTDTVSKYNLYVNVRHSFYFDWRNIYVKINTTLPNDTSFVRRVNLPLSEADGKWFGNCFGENCSVQIPIQKGAKLPMKGKYKFEIVQDMRENPLHKIKAIGLRVEKARVEE
jgi:gliding motility-associated lipoprotein GldH